MTAPVTASASLASTAEDAVRRFTARFGRDPVCVVAAPGRVNLIGEHVDYNEGLVFPMAIDRYTVIASAPRAERALRLGSSQAAEEVWFDGNLPIQRGEPKWGNYVRGVAAGFQDLGADLPGIDAWVSSSVPVGGGLSSSAALEVAMATTLEVLTERQLPEVEKALLCQLAEHRFAGVPCGIMDQFISVMACQDHVLLLDCQSRGTEQIPLTDPAISILIINSNVKHELTGGEYAERRAQCEQAAGMLCLPSLRGATLPELELTKGRMDPLIYRRARHVVSEIGRTLQAAQEMQAEHWQRLGECMYASHQSLRDDFEVSCKELDLLVDMMADLGVEGGVYGSRLTGGGFGGCTVSLVASAAVEDIASRVGPAYRGHTGIEASFFVSRPAGGARVLRAPDR